MRAWIVILVACGACFSKPQRQVFDDALVDGSLDSAVDAQDVGACIGAVCVAAGGVCELDGACHIVTTVVDANPRCPAAMPCVVECTGDACDGVDCGNASACTVQCLGASACDKQGVDCGQAPTCTVRCIGSNACERGQGGAVSVECRNSVCEVTCDGTSACLEGINNSNTCTAHCCNGACNGGTGTCVVDSTCS